MKNFIKLKPVKISAALILAAIIFSGVYATKNIRKIPLQGTAFPKIGNEYRVGTKNITKFNPIIQNKGSAPASEGLQPFTEKVIRRAQISIKIEKESFMSVFDKINSSAKLFGGYVKDANYSENKNGTTGYATVLVPSEKLNEFIQYLKTIGKTESFRLNSEDKSAEYFDLEGRLKILKSQRDLLISWLNKSKSVNDMLNIRRNLESVEEEIEQIEGRIKYIDFHTKYSEVYIMLNKSSLPGITSPAVRLLKESANRILFALFYSLMWLFIILMWLMPYGLIAYLAYAIFRKKKKNT